MISTRMPATTLTVPVFAPSRLSSSAVEPNLPEIGAVKSVAFEALLNWSTVQPYRVLPWLSGLRRRSVWNRPRKTGIWRNIGRQPMSGLAFSFR